MLYNFMVIYMNKYFQMLAYIQSSLTPFFANSCLMTYIMIKD